MVARLIADKDKFLVSKPSVDVSTATPGDLIFDSRSQKYLSAYASGYFASSLFTYDATGSSAGPLSGVTVYKKTLTYGKTFAAPPKVFLAFRSSFWDSAALNSSDCWALSSITLQYDDAIGGYYSIGDSVTISVVGLQDRAVFEARLTFGRDVYYSQPAPDYVYFLVATSA